MAPQRPLLAWPGLENFRATVTLSLLFCPLFYAIYGGADYVTGLHSLRVRIHLGFEPAIPFYAPLSAVYLSLNLLLGLAPFILRAREEFMPLYRAMAAELFAAGVMFVLLPSTSAFPAHEVTGFWGPIFRVADALNLDYNMVPSLHVTFAFTAAAAFGRYCGTAGRVFFLAWAGAIAVSTVLTHQHHILDVAAGLLLAAAARRWVYNTSE